MILEGCVAKLKIRQLNVVSPAPRPIWHKLLESDHAANIYQTPEWTDSICAVDRYVDASRLYTTPTGRQLVMPMVRRTGLPRILRVEESLPVQWGTGGLVAPGQVQPEDVTAVWADLASRHAARVRIQVENMNVQAWNASKFLPNTIIKHDLKSVIDLSGGFERVWKELFTRKARNHVRRAERAGLVVESDSTGRLVSVYYKLYLDWIKRRAEDLGLPTSIMLRRASHQEPLRKFQLVAQKFGSACNIWVARLDGQPIAAVILLIHNRHANYWRGYSNKDLAGPVPANNLLQKLAIAYACDAGCLDYNMGWSSTPSLTEYKSSFGAIPLEFPVFTLEHIPMTKVEHAASRLKENIKQLIARRRTRAMMVNRSVVSLSGSTSAVERRG